MEEAKSWGNSHGEAAASKTSHRPDVDGLRAIAVIVVVLFHAGLSGFDGGFVGVDIFFVISGFLIGGIVSREIASGVFTLGNFYSRRARRILPALFALILCTTLIGLFLLSAKEMKNFALSEALTLLGVWNIHLALHNDYFGDGSQFRPFLMNWSLGVEEQFYLLLPPFLILLRKTSQRMQVLAIAAVSLISLTASVLAAASHPTWGFFMPVTRAWELGVGVMLAQVQQSRRLAISGAAAEGLSLAGLAAILVSVFCFSERTPFPGYHALLPVAGSAMLLASENSFLNRRVLSLAPMRGVGLVSYSWYLWHWPLMAFARISSPLPPSPATLLLIALLALVIAILSWRFIEQPFRHASAVKTSTRLKRYGVALAVFCALPLAIFAAKGLPQRLPEEVAQIERVGNDSRERNCLIPAGVTAPNKSEECWSAGAGPRLVLLGDSHAAAFGKAIRRFARAHDVQYGVLTKMSCQPRLLAPAQSGDECSAFNATAIGIIAEDPSVKWVVLAGFWEAGEASATDVESRANALRRAAERLCQAGKRVVILGDVPRFEFNPIRQAVASHMPARDFVGSLLSPGFKLQDGWAPYSAMDLNAPSTERSIADVAASISGARYRGTQNSLCGSLGCRAADAEGRLFYIDDQHLSNAGAEFVLAQSGLNNDLSALVTAHAD